MPLANIASTIQSNFPPGCCHVSVKAYQSQQGTCLTDHAAPVGAFLLRAPARRFHPLPILASDLQPELHVGHLLFQADNLNIASKPRSFCLFLHHHPSGRSGVRAPPKLEFSVASAAAVMTVSDAASIATPVAVQALSTSLPAVPSLGVGPSGRCTWRN